MLFTYSYAAVRAILELKGVSHNPLADTLAAREQPKVVARVVDEGLVKLRADNNHVAGTGGALRDSIEGLAQVVGDNGA